MLVSTAMTQIEQLVRSRHAIFSSNSMLITKFSQRQHDIFREIIAYNSQSYGWTNSPDTNTIHT